MSVLEFYILFCITTSITSILDLFWPAIKLAKKDGIKNEVTEYPLFSIGVFFTINLVIAPLLFFVIIVPSLNEQAIRGLSKAIREPAKEI